MALYCMRSFSRSPYYSSFAGITRWISPHPLWLSHRWNASSNRSSTFLSAAAIRFLDKPGALAFVESLGINTSDVLILKAQEIDGSALLDSSEERLLRCGMLVGSAASIMRAIATAKSVMLTLEVNDEDEYGEIVSKMINVRICSQEQLKDLVRSHGGGSLVLEGTTTATRNLEELVNGGTYTLIGGQQQAVKRHQKWTQQADKALEVTLATEAVASAVGKELGGLEQHHNVTLTNDAGQTREFDGLLLSTDTAITVEAKHAAVESHVALVLDKAAFLLKLAQQGNGERGDLSGITSVIPVLASSYFTPSVLHACHQSGVSIVKPNGAGHSYFPSLPPAHLRRGGLLTHHRA